MQTYQPEKNLKIAKDIYKTSIDGLFFLPHHKYPDNRGFYSEVSRIPEIEQAIGKEFITKQVNHSRSNQNVVRGFHAEAWNKLITITGGKVLSVLVDIRPDSSTFGKTEKFVLGSDEESLNGAIFVSNGIANGFLVLDGPADYLYLVDALYSERDKSGDKAINLFDQDIRVEWPIDKEQMIFSDRDENAISLRELYPDKF
jgi:dTDP-4-dehydrorhamnose 3,5-epimerase